MNLLYLFIIGMKDIKYIQQIFDLFHIYVHSCLLFVCWLVFYLFIYLIIALYCIFGIVNNLNCFIQCNKN